MTRKSTSVTEDAFEHGQATKKGNESWSEWFHRAADALESQDSDVSTDPSTTDVPDDVLREAHIPDIKREVADEVENRLTRQ
ncbi:hypothetical protein SAMN05216388_101757 [Halorientalis persicus]|uniref:Uncharacterized protein n=1 Tax=Halorientalis persicus TaxID=1367881 RepID=A0A1H8RWM5_9EURY|nr:hypothetical protein [Halorientalis persicus]SEO70614.1 hypothetical protein SAMN05216388_101757 [Halorientalis persicus]